MAESSPAFPHLLPVNLGSSSIGQSLVLRVSVTGLALLLLPLEQSHFRGQAGVLVLSLGEAPLLHISFQQPASSVN